MTEEKDRVNEAKKERQEEMEKQGMETSTVETEKDKSGCLDEAKPAREERQKELDKM